jgi:hypothetical protein
MMRIYKKTAVAVLGLSAALLGGGVSAAPVTLTGTYLSYSFDDADLGLFGAASLSGDNLVFTPSNFTASSGGVQFSFQTINITVSANTGYLLSAFNLTESGGYSLTGDGASFGVTGTFAALDIEGTTGNYIPMTIGASAPLDGATSGWTALAGVTLPATGWGGADGMVGSVKLTLSNQLYATASSGSAASIYKDFVGISAITTPVPEAQTYAMMLAGLGLVGFMVRRRSRAAA